MKVDRSVRASFWARNGGSERVACKVGIAKRVTSNVFRQAFATHLLKSGKDWRTIQELLGHADVKTLPIYTHVTKGVGGSGVRSPFAHLK